MRYLLVLLLLLSTSALAQTRDPMLSFEVTSALHQGVLAWNHGDLNGFLAGYLDSDQTTYTAEGKIIHGYQALATRYRKTYGSDRPSMGHLGFRNVEVWGLGKRHALALGRWTLKRAGKPTIKGVFSLVLVKSGGAWKIFHDHTSGKPQG